MLNIKTDIPVKEDIQEAINARLAQAHDLLNEVQVLERMKLEQDVFVSKQELADRFHCDVKQVPHQIPSIRMGKTYLYKESDVAEFIKSRTKRR